MCIFTHSWSVHLHPLLECAFSPTPGVCIFTHSWSVHLHPLLEWVFTSIYSIPILRAKKCFNSFSLAITCKERSQTYQWKTKKSSAFGAVIHNFFHVRCTMKPCRLTTEISRLSLESQKLWRLTCGVLLGHQGVRFGNLYTVKKRLATFPCPAGMSLTKLSLDGNNLNIPGQGEFGKWHPVWGRKNG